MRAKNPASVQSIERGLTILEELSCEVEGLGITDLARRTNLPASTVHRLLAVFVRRGYIARDCHRRSYHLDSRLLGLGYLPASLFCELYRIICEQFATVIYSGEADEVFLKIASRSFAVRADRNSAGNGNYLIPELREVSQNAGAGHDCTGRVDGCVPMGAAMAEALYRLDALEKVRCVCLPINRSDVGNGRDRIGARGLGRFSRRKVVSILSDLETAREKMELSHLCQHTVATRLARDRCVRIDK